MTGAGAALALALAPPGVAAAQTAGADSSVHLAKQLANPVASLISVPFQSNYDWGMGPTGDGWQYKLNVQPVIPISLNADWLMVSRTILPILDQDKVVDRGHQGGLGDTVQSLFFGPKAPTPSGWLWAVGPVFQVPTATDRRLGSQSWGIGPTVVALRQRGPWTVGILANQIWSFAGRRDRRDVNATFLQPFINYTTHRAMTFSANSESTYDWVGRRWTVPVNLAVAQLFTPTASGLPTPIQAQLGYRLYIDAPGKRPNSGVRLSLVALFPR